MSFLDRLLRNMYENASQATLFVDGHDFIQRLQYFCNQAGRLTVDTEFVTFELHDLYTRLSHADLLMALNQFLLRQLPDNRHQSLSIAAIEELTKFALEHHYFTYDDKIYRYIRGSPLNYSFTQLLFDIYLHQWQIILVRHMRVTDQFYGRYHNRGIFTWNKGRVDFHKYIKELNEQNPDVQLTLSSGNKVHFLQAQIENRQGQLYTCVHHDHKKQPFVLPYTAGHPRLLHRQWFRFSMARAIEYCPSFDDFMEQSLRVELTYLANGYSLDFVKYHMKQFCQRFKSFHHDFIIDRLNYKPLRQQVFRYYNTKAADLKRQRQQDPMITHPSFISFFYLFDWGNRIEFNRKFHELWSTIIQNDPQFARLNFKVYLRCKHHYLSHTLLVQYK